MVNYTNTIIYKLCNKDFDGIYVGSTTNFESRRRQHKHACNNVIFKSKVYRIIRNNGGWDIWDMIVIEKYEATDKKDQLIRERYWMEALNSTLNDQSSYRTEEENIELEKIWAKGYQKEYREKNKDSLGESQKIWLNTGDNREKTYKRTNEWRRRMRTCECGDTMTNRNIGKHKKTQSHKDKMIEILQDVQ
jgi:predicted GIY-YIG superfamily endonuclease